jgi:uncharacterized protein YkwD
VTGEVVSLPAPGYAAKRGRDGPAGERATDAGALKSRPGGTETSCNTNQEVTMVVTRTVVNTLTSAMRPVQRVLGGSVVAAVATACLVSGSTSGTTAGAAHDTEVSTSVRTTLVSGSTLSAPDFEKKVQRLVNVRRERHDRRPLTLAPCTDKVANRWSTHLAATETLVHQSMRKVLRTCDAAYAGETIGSGDLTPTLLVTMWMQSPTHRKILLSASPRRIGVGARQSAGGEWFVTANFMRF